MKLGFALPVSGSWASPGSVRHVAGRAEELGYASVWTFQRLLSPVDGSWGETYRSVLDPLVTLGYVAAATSRVRLGVAVLNLPFAAPALVAKQLATLDVLSGGRAEAGLGTGWAAEEFAAAGVDRAARGRRAEEFVPLLRSLLHDDVVDHAGEFYVVPRSRVRPRAVQPRLPLLLGGHAEAALRRAGRLADGWVSSSRQDLTEIGRSIGVVREAAAAAGRDPDELRMVCRGVVRLRSGRVAAREPLTGSVAQVRSDLAALAAQGVTEVFVDLNFDPEVGSPDADPVESLRRADEALEGLAPGA
ncbi:MAG TPA: TIGR03619 family F420-dependent LLM class oxidoreductase [Pseudonocardiaceae bacterium]